MLKIHKNCIKMICLFILISTLILAYAHKSFAQNVEEKFQDIFITAGYATAFGAALGAAMLSFHSNPTQHLRYIAVGASLGFISGSIFASYIIFSPSFVKLEPNEKYNNQIYITKNDKHILNINPVFDTSTSKLIALNTNIIILRW